jgi:hypothetical protein
MTINYSEYEIRKGAFAVVFIDVKGKRAFKLFKSYEHPDLDGEGKEKIGAIKTNEYRRRVFDTEFDAYVNVQNSSLLKELTPKFFGKIEVEYVIENGKDISNQFLSECCLALEYIGGKSIKLGNFAPNEIIETNPEYALEDVYDEFKEQGIRYLIDATAIINEKEFKIIDFGTIDPFTFEPIP